uniref:Uncharacterized protein n=1 Tax=Knipowitschia caucasica TaxID=637954 RepID=A0AAV2L696_KNICA
MESDASSSPLLFLPSPLPPLSSLSTLSPLFSCCIRPRTPRWELSLGCHASIFTEEAAHNACVGVRVRFFLDALRDWGGGPIVRCGLRRTHAANVAYMHWIYAWSVSCRVGSTLLREDALLPCPSAWLSDIFKRKAASVAMTGGCDIDSY